MRLLMHTTSVSLIERLRQPDAEQAWARFVELYTPLLFHWANRLGLPEADADDLVQDVFTILLRSLPEFLYDRKKSFRAWLRTVLFNKWRDHLRRARLRPGHGDAELALTTVPDHAELLEEQEYRQHLVGRALELMRVEFQPTTWRACWELVVAERSAADVAAELGISVDSVYTAKSRVLRRLRAELDGLFE
jgi:RNA polymerase sigma-70 factor, ECF subfamily